MTEPRERTLQEVRQKLNVANAKSQVFYFCNYKIAHHTVDLWFLALGQVDDVHAVVVEVLHTTAEVLAQERSRFSRQRNGADTELCETKKIRTKQTKKKKFRMLGEFRMLN